MIAPLRHRTVRGHIRYLSQKPEQFGREIGDESFIIAEHGDGAMTVRAHCRVREPAPTLLRDVVYSTDANRRPFDGYARLSVDDRFVGAGWIRFGPDGVECQGYGASAGRVSEQMDSGVPVQGLRTLAAIGDAQLCRLFDRSGGPEQQGVRVLVPSPPKLAQASLGLEYAGEETVSVEAGEFDCLHFRLLEDGPNPDCDLWVTRDDFILVQTTVGGDEAKRYELILLQVEPAGD